MIVGIAVDTTVDSKDASAVTSISANVTVRRRRGSKRGEDMAAGEYRVSPLRVLAGTSGFSYKEWKGSFYPEDLPAPRMLAYYAERLPAVEINNTFYRMPKPALLEGWAAEVPPEFRFVLKASQRITHFKRLKEAGDDVAYFFGVAAVLGERLGPALFQLPPNLKKDLPRLEAFLETIPQDRRPAFEFRHASWFEDDVFEALRRKGAAL